MYCKRIDVIVGNTWAGGTGGYNTAGLGGIGGPFRLDAGHAVHAMPMEVKDRVPKEVLAKARRVAEIERRKRLQVEGGDREGMFILAGDRHERVRRE